VDGEGDDGGASRDRLRPEVPPQAARADRRRGVDEPAAGTAAQEEELAVAPTAPEVLVERVHLRERAGGARHLATVTSFPDSSESLPRRRDTAPSRCRAARGGCR